MRLIGTLTSAPEAQRFVAYLLTQNIPAQAEQDDGAFAIWVKNEDQVDTAKSALDHYRTAPSDARYSGVESKAAQLERAEREKVDRARKNLVDVRTKWRGGSAFKRAPLTCILIGLSVFVFFLQQTSEETVSMPQRWLSFTSLSTTTNSNMVAFARNGYSDIQSGQAWRLLTPIFLHFSTMHLVFNMLALYWLGSMFEGRYQAWRLALLVLLVGVLSNVAQYAWEGSPLFGGMSGVVYGLFGFVWIKSLYDPQSGMSIDPFNVIMLLGWLFLCMAAALPQFSMLGSALRVANTAHFVGLAVGMAIAGLTLLLKRPN